MWLRLEVADVNTRGPAAKIRPYSWDWRHRLKWLVVWRLCCAGSAGAARCEHVHEGTWTWQQRFKKAKKKKKACVVFFFVWTILMSVVRVDTCLTNASMWGVVGRVCGATDTQTQVGRGWSEVEEEEGVITEDDVWRGLRGMTAPLSFLWSLV